MCLLVEGHQFGKGKRPAAVRNFIARFHIDGVEWHVAHTDAGAVEDDRPDIGQATELPGADGVRVHCSVAGLLAATQLVLGRVVFEAATLNDAHRETARHQGLGHRQPNWTGAHKTDIGLKARAIGHRAPIDESLGKFFLQCCCSL